MHKRNRRGRASFREFDLQRLLTCAINDASPYLGRCTAAELHGGLQLDQAGFRGLVDGLLHSQELDLHRGGVDRYIALRQLQGLLKKLPEWNAKTEAERKLASMDTFFSSEKKCARTNRRLGFYRKHWSRASKMMPETVINTAALIVQEILGPLGPDERFEILDNARFGSGATFSHKRAESSPYYKLSRKHTITREALPTLQEWMALSPRIHEVLKDQKLEVVEGNRLSTVPKDWDKDRLIAIEPSWNVFLQLGINGYLKRRLKRFGLHLDDQTVGWQWAREGSISGDFATVDLSSASDTVSLAIVERLVPREWFVFLDSLRSKSYFHEGEWHRYHKFSSMGNGFTFPLETILFYALAKATAKVCGTSEAGITTFGDDIIVHRTTFVPFLQVLKWSGFSPNVTKSYGFGPFRETCGRDYLQGVNVRPVYLRKIPKNVEDIYSIHNRLLSFSLIPVPRTLDYLRSCVDNPHTGPGYLTNADSNIEPFDVYWSYGRQSLSIRRKRGFESSWSERSRELENYFFSETPTRAKVHRDYQCLVYTCVSLSKRMAPDKSATDMYLRYLLFLLGIEGGKVLSTSRKIWFDKTQFLSYWPNLEEVRRSGLELAQSY